MSQLSDRLIDRIRTAEDEMYNLFCRHQPGFEGDPDRRIRFYFYATGVLYPDHPAFLRWRGEWNVERSPVYMQFVAEKASRLAGHLDEGHITSHQSRDETKDRYAGAVFVTDEKTGAFTLLSCSGLPELADEAYCLGVAVFAGMITISRAIEIISDHANPYFEALVPLLETTTIPVRA